MYYTYIYIYISCVNYGALGTEKDGELGGQWIGVWSAIQAIHQKGKSHFDHSHYFSTSLLQGHRSIAAFLFVWEATTDQLFIPVDR